MIKVLEHGVSDLGLRDTSFWIEGTKIVVVVYQAQDPDTGDPLMPAFIGPQAFHLTPDLAREVAQLLTMAADLADRWWAESQ